MKNILTRQIIIKVIKLLLYYWAPVILWTIVIFLFSSFPTQKASQIHWQDFIIKKSAHILEYFTLSLLTFRALRESGMDSKKALIYALFFSSLYGISDEYHQSFTPGREPKIRDVIIDLTGSLLGVISLKYFAFISTRSRIRYYLDRAGLI